jgi:hypothetical protein
MNELIPYTIIAPNFLQDFVAEPLEVRASPRTPDGRGTADPFEVGDLIIFWGH